MDLLIVAELILLFLIFLSALYIFLSSTRPPLPGPGLLEYLPNGLVYPMLHDPHHFSRVVENLGHIYGDVFSLWMGPIRVVVTAVPEDAAQIFTAVNDFDRPPAIKAVFNTLAPGGIFCMSGTQHRDLRKKLRDGFNHRMLDSFHDHTTNAIEELCESLTSVAGKGIGGGLSEVLDLSEVITVATFRVMTNVAFGTSMDRESRVEFHDAVRQVANEMTEDMVGYPIRQALTPFGVRNRFFEIRDKIRATCARFIQKRRDETKAEKDERAPDLLDAILSADDHSISALTSVTTEFTLAGTYPVSQSVVWAVYEICCNTRVRTEVERELSRELANRPIDESMSFEDLGKLPYLNSTWKETTRMHPVGPFITRKTTRNVTLKGSGIHLPKGTEVFANYRRCQMSPELWSDPESFKPERWSSKSVAKNVRIPPGAYLPYGLGQHNCPGSFLADYEGPLILAELYRRFKFTLACTPDQIHSSTTFVESPTYRNEKTGVDMGVPVHVQLKT